MIYQFAAGDYEAPIRIVAKVVKGNDEPRKTLEGNCFVKDEGLIGLDPTTFGGRIDHMVESGDDKVWACIYRFVPSRFDQVMWELLDFIEKGGVQRHRSGQGTIKIRLDPKLSRHMPHKALQYQREWIINPDGSVGRLTG